jgi:outer membrane receptor protein involved in Fe transport
MGVVSRLVWLVPLLVLGRAVAAEDAVVPDGSPAASAPPSDEQPASATPEAQTSPEAESPSSAHEVQLPEVQVRGHYKNKVGTSDAASAGTATKQLIEDRPILRPGEVLELVPGLIITQHSGAGKANQYFLRGFNLDHGTDFATTLDGVPINMRSHAHGQGYTDLNFVIPELIGQMEYYKGPYFASKGDFASAGAADMHYVELMPNHVVQVTGGMNKYYRGFMAASPEIGKGNLLLGMEYLHNDGPWDRPDDYRKFNGVMRYTRAIGDGKLSLDGMVYVGNWFATDQIPQRAVTEGIIDRFGSLDKTTGGSSHRYSLSANWQQPVGDGQFQAGAYVVRYDLDLFSNFTFFLDDPVNGDQFEQLDRRWYYGTSGSWKGMGEMHGVNVKAEAGWEARQDRVDPVGLYHTKERTRLGTTRQDFVRETSGALYAQVDLGWTSWLRTVGGLRFDAYRFQVDNQSSAAAGGPDPRNSGSATASRASPKLSAIFGPWASTEFFANFGYGFHSNDARGVLTHVDPASGEAVTPVTPLVQTRGGEVGVRTELVPDVQTSVALWRLDMDSELLFTGDAGTTEPSRASRRQGLEWSVRWQPMQWLLFDLDVSWSRARFSSASTDPTVTGDFIPGAIEKAVSAGASIHELGPFSASLFLRYFGPRPLIEDDSIRSAASTSLNAQVSYRITEHVKATFDVFNLTNNQVEDISYYYASRLQGEPPEGQNDLHFHPAEKREVRGTVTFEF